MDGRVDGARLLAVAGATLVIGLASTGVAFGALQIATGRIGMADIVHRLPKGLAVHFVEDPDWTDRLLCEGLDETDPAAVQRYADDRGLTLEVVASDDAPGRFVAVDWVYWQDRLIAYAEDAPPVRPGPSGSCPG